MGFHFQAVHEQRASVVLLVKWADECSDLGHCVNGETWKVRSEHEVCPQGAKCRGVAGHRWVMPGTRPALLGA